MRSDFSEQNHRTATRRGFIKDSSLLLAGSTLGNRLPVHVEGSDTLLVGLIGCGGQGTAVLASALQNLQTPIKLIAVADVFEDRVQQCLRALRSGPGRERVDVQPRRFVGLDGYRAMMESDVQVVVLATPPAFRPLHFSAAIAAGKHVYAESPVAVDPAGANQFLSAGKLAAQRGLSVCVGLESRHQRRYCELVASARAGEIGKIGFCRAYWNQGPMWVRQRSPRQSELEFQLRNWYYFTWLSGDHIVEQHSANLDVINWLMDSTPVRAQGTGGRLLRTAAECGQIYDHHTVEYTYADGTKLFSMCRQMPHCWNQVGEYAHGSVAVIDFAAGEIRQASDEARAERLPERRPRVSELSRLLKSLSIGEVVNECQIGYDATMTALMGRMATYSGKQVTWTNCCSQQARLANVESLRTLADPAPVLPNADGAYDIYRPGNATS